MYTYMCISVFRSRGFEVQDSASTNVAYIQENVDATKGASAITGREIRVSDKCTACGLYSVASYSRSTVRMIWPLVPMTECVLGL